MDRDELLTTYEVVPYESNPIHFAHPDTLATAAYLRGIEPPAFERCRVLELGCAAGGHLMPIAEAWPSAQFVGIDLSPRQIADGRRLVDALGLGNLELKAMSILDVGPELGTFDYIVAHGVFSWVPVAVRDKILEICCANLAPNGVAYLSYNVNPGWIRGTAMRELMRFQTRGETEPRQRVAQARALCEFYETALPAGNFGDGLREWAARLGRTDDILFLHDHLEPVSQPYYFHEFAALATAHGLRYLGEAGWCSSTADLSPSVQAGLQSLCGDDEIAFEQHLDFLRGRAFRRSLVCHAEQPLSAPSPERLARLKISSVCKPVSPRPDVRSKKNERFVGDLESLTTGDPFIKAILVALAEAAPYRLPLDQLWLDVRALLQLERGQLTEEDLGAAVLFCHQSNLVALHLDAPRLTTTPGRHPTVTALVRAQAARGPDISSLLHRTVTVSDADRGLLALCDGTRDRPTLLAELGKTGPLTAKQLDASLVRLAAAALFIE